jgi:hypothetical protein
VLRRTGRWVKGRFVIDDPPLTLNFYGAVQPATTREIEQLGIGDREKGVMKFFTRQPHDIHITRELGQNNDGSIQISDEIEFLGSAYKVLQVAPWRHGGWTRAFASLKG